MRSLSKGKLIAAACTGALTVPLAAQAQTRQPGRAGVYLGAFVTNRSSDARLGSSSGPGTDIDLESALGLERTTTVARFGGYLWFGKRQRFDFSVFDLSRSASRPLQAPIDFGDLALGAGTVIDSTMDLTITKADYTWAPFSRANGYLGITAGLYVSSADLSLSAAATGAAASEKLTAPLPVVGFRGEHRVTDRIGISGAVQWFDYAVGDASGHLRDFYVGADYAFGRHMSIGLAYNDVTMNIMAEQPSGRSGKLNWDYDGWMIFFKAQLGHHPD